MLANGMLKREEQAEEGERTILLVFVAVLVFWLR